MRFVFVLFICLFFTGCATVHVKTDNCEATYSTFFKDMEAANFGVCGGSAEVLSSDTNTRVLEAVLNSLIKP